MSYNNSSFPRTRHLLAHDFSGSTWNNDKYFETVKNIYYNSPVPFTDIILWDSQVEVVSPSRYEHLLNIKEGDGGTYPHVIIDWMLKNNFNGDVVLITDGQIPVSHVESLDKILDESKGKIKISFIKCYLIQTETKKIDTTVIAPFIRRIPNEVIYFGEKEEPQIITTGKQTQEELIETIKSIKTIEEFEDQSTSVFSNVVTKMMGKPANIEIRDEILRLQKRLIFQLRLPPKNFDMQAFLEAFKNHDLEKMKQLSLNLNQLYLQQHQNMVWPSLIFHLLRMTNGSLDKVYSVHALGTGFQADRIRRADVAEHFEATETESTNCDADFVCPITYEEESDVVLLVKKPTNPLLAGIDHDIVNDIITCPLAALKYKEFIQSFIDHIDHPISLSAMKHAQDSNLPIKVSPLTRAPIIGGLCLGAAEDHAKATNWTFANVMTGGKKVGNMDQWFALLWYLVEMNQIPYLNPILPKIREHMIFRLHNHHGTATLTGIPYICQTSLPVGICCWFSLNIDPNRFLSAHSSEVPVFIKMAKLAGYPIEDSVIRNALIVSTEESCKRMGSAILPHLINASYVTSKNSPNVIIDGKLSEEERKKALEELPLAFSEVPVEIMRIVVNHIIGGKAKEEIPFVNWAYGLEPCKMPPIPICPTTLRPFLLVPPTFTPWPKAAVESFCPEPQLINCHAQYINYVNKYRKFPSKAEFAEFCMKMLVPKKKPTLPAQIDQFIDCVVDGYNEVFSLKSVSPDDFVKITGSTIWMKTRIEQEQKYYETQSIKPPKGSYSYFLDRIRKH
ncbi:hypothetical protein M9Y10_016808 [Tritrichomonas musculus]|uniref:Uncharacterized protein n=1 Tax=Tritrichomonas musculus TaxID=1915356 RepID=A0ABR2HY68_9EUKA